MKSATTRFSDRVDDYIKYRPGYPQKIIEVLTDEVGLTQHSIIADIGSGTGISTGLFISNGNKVYAVEPNKEMREPAELFYSENKNFICINGAAEQSNLKEHSINIIFCGTAFHWFNRNETKIEFNRILKPNGHIVLVWNVRKEQDDFQKGYEMILKSIPEYNEVMHRHGLDKEIIYFFSLRTIHKETVPNSQTLNLDGLKGRLKSSSYCPKEGIEYENLMHEMDTLFHKFNKNGVIKFEYETIIYWC
jgi:ubiquinone/menaquinone biosynthesis C-methylase UbiE